MNENKLQVFTLTVVGKCAILRHEEEKEGQSLHSIMVRCLKLTFEGN